MSRGFCQLRREVRRKNGCAICHSDKTTIQKIHYKHETYFVPKWFRYPAKDTPPVYLDYHEVRANSPNIAYICAKCHKRWDRARKKHFKRVEIEIALKIFDPLKIPDISPEEKLRVYKEYAYWSPIEIFERPKEQKPIRLFDIYGPMIENQWMTESRRRQEAYDRWKNRDERKRLTEFIEGCEEALSLEEKIDFYILADKPMSYYFSAERDC